MYYNISADNRFNRLLLLFPLLIKVFSGFRCLWLKDEYMLIREKLEM